MLWLLLLLLLGCRRHSAIKRLVIIEHLGTLNVRLAITTHVYGDCLSHRAIWVDPLLSHSLISTISAHTHAHSSHPAVHAAMPSLEHLELLLIHRHVGWYLLRPLLLLLLLSLLLHCRCPLVLLHMSPLLLILLRLVQISLSLLFLLK